MTAYDLALALDQTLADAVKAQKDALALLQRARLQNVHLLAKITQAELQRPQVNLHVLPADLEPEPVMVASQAVAPQGKISRACADGKHQGTNGRGYTCRRKWCLCLCHHQALELKTKKKT